MKQPKGFIPVMLTPFTAEGQIDYPTLDKLIRFYLDAGAAGLFANCLSSEMFELTPEERLQLTKHVVDQVAGAVPVVSTGTFGGPIAEQAEFVKQIHATGVKAVIVITSLLAAQDESEEIFSERFHELLSLTPGVPLGFYECPVPYKRIIAPAMLAEFIATGRVIYHKDTSLDIKSIREKIAGAAGHDNFGLYDAYMAHAVISLKAGSAGLSCIQGNYFPELITWLCNNYDNEHATEEVNKVQQFLIDNMDVMHDVYPICAKYFLRQRGFDINMFTRREVGTFTPAHEVKVEKLYDDYLLLQEQLALEAAI